MNPNDYQKLAARTECSQVEARTRIINNNPNDTTIVGQITPTRLLHACIGLSGDVGELCSAIEKWLYYGQPLDEVNLKEEIGDCLWYLALACNAAGFKMEEVMAANISKLEKRYPEKFTDFNAAEENRDRAAERKIITVGAEDDRPFYDDMEARKIIRETDFLCPHCKYCLNDEVVKNLMTGFWSVGACPECMKTFKWEGMTVVKT